MGLVIRHFGLFQTVMADDGDKNRRDDERKLEDHVENLQLTSKNTDKSLSEDSESPVRETTQTDHLNKRLLGAFLERLNEKGDNLQEDVNIDQENDDWENETTTNK